MCQNEIYWRQRSRVCWLKDGDRNTAFFHKKASNRRARNRISSLQDENGVRQSHPDSIQKKILDYFEKIFCSEGLNTEALNMIIAAMDVRVTPSMNE